jgi:hypothetical protein
MSSTTRLANKTIWALEDIIARCRATRRAIDRAAMKANERKDTSAAAALLPISRGLADIEGLARDARRGEYHGEDV